MLAKDDAYILAALEEARTAYADGEVPVGAVIVKTDTIIARGRNTRERDNVPTGHAEINAILAASRALRNWRLVDCHLYVTVEPCIMCVGAIYHSRIARVVYGCRDYRWGGLGSVADLTCLPKVNHRIEVVASGYGQACGELMRQFFRERRLTSI